MNEVAPCSSGTAATRVPGVSDHDRDAVATSVAGTLQGYLPRADDRFRAVPEDLDDETAFMRELATEAATMLEDKPAESILRWAAGVVPRFAVTSSFGADSAVLLHLVSDVAPQVPVLFLDTGFHFDETLVFRRELARELGLTVLDMQPDLSVSQQAQRYGAELYKRDPDACCGMRKTAPLRRALANFDGWATGVRRSQTPERAGTPVVEARPHAGRYLVKVAPLARWSDDDVAAYLDEHDLPRHPLVEQGYPSIGCWPCTRQVTDGSDPRAGRWAEFDGKTECGIHLADDGEALRRTTTPG